MTYHFTTQMGIAWAGDDIAPWYKYDDGREQTEEEFAVNWIYSLLSQLNFSRCVPRIPEPLKMSTQEIYDHVTERYSAASRGTALEYGASVAKAFGYSEEELADIPQESNLGLSCGNPMAMASIREVCCLNMTSS